MVETLSVKTVLLAEEGKEIDQLCAGTLGSTPMPAIPLDKTVAEYLCRSAGVSVAKGRRSVSNRSFEPAMLHT
jgi:hypothetical protein